MKKKELYGITCIKVLLWLALVVFLLQLLAKIFLKMNIQGIFASTTGVLVYIIISTYIVIIAVGLKRDSNYIYLMSLIFFGYGCISGIFRLVGNLYVFSDSYQLFGSLISILLFADILIYLLLRKDYFRGKLIKLDDPRVKKQEIAFVLSLGILFLINWIGGVLI